jgi:hypothetical protein
MMDDIAGLLDTYEKEDDDGKSETVTSKLKAYYFVFDRHSAYAEVRASVLSTDDPTLPVDTFRVWLLGIFFVTIFACFNQVPNELCYLN